MCILAVSWPQYEPEPDHLIFYNLAGVHRSSGRRVHHGNRSATSSVHQRALCHPIGQLKDHVCGVVKLNREILFRICGFRQGAVGDPDRCSHDLSFLTFFIRPGAGNLTVMKILSKSDFV